ncbi:hypothetical protein V5F34_08645 [Xanthobacter autotrophicus]|uniref:hypothetical protein n=1 Tax=Xanthobacter autotrophicus TaxID=280 RepID=UPI00372AB17F
MTMQQRLSQNLLRLTSLLAQATGRTPWSTLQRLTGKGNLIASIEAGNTFYVATYDEILQAYSNNWPAGLVWPADIERPDPQLVMSEPVVRTKAREAAQ